MIQEIDYNLAKNWQNLLKWVKKIRSELLNLAEMDYDKIVLEYL